MNKPDDARKEFELVLSGEESCFLRPRAQRLKPIAGKPLEANASTRKGKYSLEVRFSVPRLDAKLKLYSQSALIMRTHAALEALDHAQPV